MTRADQLFHEHQDQIHRRTDGMFAVLLTVQYAAGLLAALYISPLTWVGSDPNLHIHVWAAFLLGGLIVSLPIYLALQFPGNVATRHAIAISQMLTSALLIHLTGGRIETHFHIFGSLAFLGFYRDWKVLISASVIVAADHYLRGVYWPQSVFGILTPSSWRWLEHTGWVLFEDFFIILATLQSLSEMREIAVRRAALEETSDERARSIVQLEQVEGRLREALEARDTFLSVCGHELKTPLTSLSLSTQLVEKQTEGNAMPKVQRYVQQTRTQIDRLSRLVDDILDMGRVGSNRLTLQRAPVDLTEIAQTVIERCSPLLQANQCEVTLEESGAVDGNWDRFRIEQVVLNLLTNAIKYGSGKPVRVRVTGKNGMARLSVQDSGMGIAPTDRQRIFERFERVNDTGSIQGLGLGLYISKKIVEQHGGSISVDTNPGGGSIFTLELETTAFLDPVATSSAAHPSTSPRG